MPGRHCGSGGLREACKRPACDHSNIGVILAMVQNQSGGTKSADFFQIRNVYPKFNSFFRLERGKVGRTRRFHLSHAVDVNWKAGAPPLLVIMDDCGSNVIAR